MKQRNQKEGVASRRRFLKTFAAATGGVAAAGAMGNVAAEQSEVAVEPEPAKEKHGYKETQHVKDYYARARL